MPSPRHPLSRLAIADGVRSSSLTAVLSEGFGFLQDAPYLVIGLLVFLVSTAIPEFASHNATTTLVVPFLFEVAWPLHVHPLLLMVPGTIRAQLSFLLPTSTLPNIVGYMTGHIEVMVKDSGLERPYFMGAKVYDLKWVLVQAVS